MVDKLGIGSLDILPIYHSEWYAGEGEVWNFLGVALFWMFVGSFQALQRRNSRGVFYLGRAQAIGQR